MQMRLADRAWRAAAPGRSNGELNIERESVVTQDDRSRSKGEQIDGTRPDALAVNKCNGKPSWSTGLKNRSGSNRYLFPFCLALILLCDCDQVPKPARTETRMYAAKYRILTYSRANHRLPATLADLPNSQFADNETEDGWGRQLIYHSDPNGNVTLSSLGKDGLPGGTREDKDIKGVFACVSSNGSWNDTKTEWHYKPRWDIETPRNLGPFNGKSQNDPRGP